jgi:hypothetical protein
VGAAGIVRPGTCALFPLPGLAFKVAMFQYTNDETVGT